MMVVGWLDDGGCVGCVGPMREMTMGKMNILLNKCV